MTAAALIVAAGRGHRVGGDVPKQYAPVGGISVLERTVVAFSRSPAIAAVQVVIRAEDADVYRAAVRDTEDKLRPPVVGGATRQASVLAGLEALAAMAPDLVLVHDAARPFVSSGTIERVVAALDRYDGAIAALPLTDTLKRAAADGTISATVERSGLWRAQTPQGFRFRPLLAAHRKAAASGRGDFTDDAAVAEWAGLGVALVEDSAENIKITTAEDLAAADRKLSQGVALETCVGQGFDVHRFVPGDHVWLCGVRVPHTHRLEGHSDADAPLHALTDAILGALGEGDIGQHFPPSDPQWKGAPSRVFLADAARRVAARGGRIAHVDISIICEQPRIGPHREAMKAAVAAVLGLAPDRVGLKATTSEGLGFTGRGEGLAALAMATVLLPA